MADDGFLARWSRRKSQVRDGHRLEDESPQAAVPAVVATPGVAPDAAAPVAAVSPDEAPAHDAPASPPPPTLADVDALGRDADFSRFVSPGVEPQVQRAALKKLFSDPHFNVVDGLDTYIDDYHKPDPLPAHLLRRMAQSSFLGLWRDDAPAAAGTGDEGRDESRDEDADLRLQPHDAARPGGADEGAAGQPGEAA